MNDLPLFTQEQWREIYEARARLEAWRCTFQPYPAYTEETPEPEKQIIHIHTHIYLDRLVASDEFILKNIPEGVKDE